MGDSTKVIMWFVSMAVVLCCQAQKQSTIKYDLIPRTIMKASVVPLFFDTYELGVERYTRSPLKSLQVSVGYRTRSDNYDKSNGILFDLAYREYFSSNATSKIPQLSGAYYSFFIGGGYY